MYQAWHPRDVTWRHNDMTVFQDPGFVSMIITHCFKFIFSTVDVFCTQMWHHPHNDDYTIGLCGCFVHHNHNLQIEM